MVVGIFFDVSELSVMSICLICPIGHIRLIIALIGSFFSTFVKIKQKHYA